jgi:hypothetical protein
MTPGAQDGLRTGEVARLFDVAEYRLANLIRFRQIDVPPVVNGRRVWRPQDVDAARRVLVAKGVTVAMTAVPAAAVATTTDVRS